jgi:hypothetical protein
VQLSLFLGFGLDPSSYSRFGPEFLFGLRPGFGLFSCPLLGFKPGRDGGLRPGLGLGSGFRFGVCFFLGFDPRG